MPADLTIVGPKVREQSDRHGRSEDRHRERTQRNGSWQYGLTAPMSHNRGVMQREAKAIAHRVIGKHRDGVDIDEEELHAGGRDPFSTLFLAFAPLQAHGKSVSLNVFAKASDARYARTGLRIVEPSGRQPDQVW